MTSAFLVSNSFVRMLGSLYKVTCPADMPGVLLANMPDAISRDREAQHSLRA